MQHQRRTDPGAHRSLTFLLRLLASKTPTIVQKINSAMLSEVDG